MEMKFEVDVLKSRHMKKASIYNVNYYKLEGSCDWVTFYENNILREIYLEESDTYEYSLGRFKDSVFIAVLDWMQDYSVIEIKKEVI